MHFDRRLRPPVFFGLVNPARCPRQIVIGAVAAGLAAAAKLGRAGLSVTILEARKRIGGRMFTERDSESGIAIEYGAEFIHGLPPGNLATATVTKGRGHGIHGVIRGASSKAN